MSFKNELQDIKFKSNVEATSPEFVSSMREWILKELIVIIKSECKKWAKFNNSEVYLEFNPYAMSLLHYKIRIFCFEHKHIYTWYNVNTESNDFITQIICDENAKNAFISLLEEILGINVKSIGYQTFILSWRE